MTARHVPVRIDPTPTEDERRIAALLYRPDDGPPTWRESALCLQLGVDDDLWFPAKGEGAGPAKQVCAACTVRTECLEDALTRDEPFGIRGGMSVRERRRITRARRAAAKPVEQMAA